MLKSRGWKSEQIKMKFCGRPFDAFFNRKLFVNWIILFALGSSLISCNDEFPAVIFYPSSCEVAVLVDNWGFQEVESYSEGHSSQIIWKNERLEGVNRLNICHLNKRITESREKASASLEFWVGRIGTMKGGWTKLHLEISPEVWKRDSIRLEPISSYI